MYKDEREVWVVLRFWRPSIDNIKLHWGYVGWEESLCGRAFVELKVSRRIWKVTEVLPCPTATHWSKVSHSMLCKQMR